MKVSEFKKIQNTVEGKIAASTILVVAKGSDTIFPGENNINFSPSGLWR